MCADSRFPVAGTTCCDADGNNPFNICVFKGERTTYGTAEDRCAAYGTGYSTCDWNTVPINWECGTDVDYIDWGINEYSGMRFSWSSAPCSMSAQINRDGKVAIIHDVGSNTVKERVGLDTGTYFGVYWNGGGSFPQASSSCGGIAGCQVQGTTCVCSASVVTSPVFSGSELPSGSDVTSLLHIGATDPSLYDAGYYHLCTAPACNSKSYKIYSRTRVDNDTNIAADLLNVETIFEVVNAKTSSPLFLSNEESKVDLGGGHSFRNPPQYNSPVDPTQRDALYETDSILEEYIHHPNTAPFLAMKLINYLVTANPSPCYVKAVADAFSTGSYTSGGIDFGSGNYGDLESTVAAIMLDDEARSTTLDDDGNSGRAREPLLMIIHIMRSMGLSTATGAPREIDMIYLLERGVGQEAFRSPSVFSFFLNEYQPVGPVLNKGLTSPEAQLFDAPKLLGFINGLFSLPLYGLSDAIWWQGFGEGRSRYLIPGKSSQSCINTRGL